MSDNKRTIFEAHEPTDFPSLTNSGSRAFSQNLGIYKVRFNNESISPVAITEPDIEETLKTLESNKTVNAGLMRKAFNGWIKFDSVSGTLLKHFNHLIRQTVLNKAQVLMNKNPDHYSEEFKTAVKNDSRSVKTTQLKNTPKLKPATNSVPTTRDMIRDFVSNKHDAIVSQVMGDTRQELIDRVVKVNTIQGKIKADIENNPEFRGATAVNNVLSNFADKNKIGDKNYPLVIFNNKDDDKTQGIENRAKFIKEFGEVFSPVAVICDRATGNGADVLKGFFGVNDFETLYSRAKIFYPGARNYQLIDSYIEYDNKIVGISTKKGAGGGTKLSSLAKAIEDIKSNSKALDMFKRTLKSNPELQKAWDIIQVLMSPRNTSEKAVFELLPYFTNIGDKNDNLAYNDVLKTVTNTTAPIGPDNLKLFSNPIQTAFKSHNPSLNDIQIHLITAICKTVNANKAVSELCTWILNHGNIIQVNIFTEGDAKNSKNKLVISNIVATWPSQAVDTVILAPSYTRSGEQKAFTFKLLINESHSEDYGLNNPNYNTTTKPEQNGKNKTSAQWVAAGNPIATDLNGENQAIQLTNNSALAVVKTWMNNRELQAIASKKYGATFNETQMAAINRARVNVLLAAYGSEKANKTSVIAAQEFVRLPEDKKISILQNQFVDLDDKTKIILGRAVLTKLLDGSAINVAANTLENQKIILDFVKNFIQNPVAAINNAKLSAQRAGQNNLPNTEVYQNA